jgi:hypothetical protein
MNYMKPFFIDDWPFVKHDHDEISRKIITVFYDHQRKKLGKELRNVSSSPSKSDEKVENDDKTEIFLQTESASGTIQRKKNSKKSFK